MPWTRPTHFFALLALALCLSLLAFPREAAACSCYYLEDPLEEAERADAVFLARVTDVDTVEYNNCWLMRQFRRWVLDEHGDGSRRPMIRASFEVVEGYTGITEDDRRILTLASSSACGYSKFEEGNQTLIYALRYDDGRLFTSLCTPTKPAEGAEEEIEILRSHFLD